MNRFYSLHYAFNYSKRYLSAITLGLAQKIKRALSNFHRLTYMFQFAAISPFTNVSQRPSVLKQFSFSLYLFLNKRNDWWPKLLARFLFLKSNVGLNFQLYNIYYPYIGTIVSGAESKMRSTYDFVSLSA